MKTFKRLPSDELDEVLSAPAEKARDLFIGGFVDDEKKILSLVRGNLQNLIVPFSLFTPSGTAEPDFSQFEILDHGQTLSFGDDYDAAADFVLYMLDPDFRIRSNSKLVHFDEGFGASLRRLRLLLKLSRNDFTAVSAETIKEIEAKKISRPQGDTLRVICDTLGVSEDDIETY